MDFFLEQMEQRGTEVAGWLGWYAVAHATDSRTATLVGTGGYMGPPDADGMVEIGYSVSEQWRGQGFATEMVAAFVERAKELGVRRVTARTLSSNPPSIAVLERNGFHLTFPTETHLVFERLLQD
jgi:RimJ/RimL family protein N-acetyltransferase